MYTCDPERISIRAYVCDLDTDVLFLTPVDTRWQIWTWLFLLCITSIHVGVLGVRLRLPPQTLTARAHRCSHPSLAVDESLID